MNALPKEIHTYISNFIGYTDILTTLKHINQHFNCLEVRKPSLPHGVSIICQYYKPDRDNIRLDISIDGRFKWFYEKVCVAEAGDV
jgi:hypothetical protein